MAEDNAIQEPIIVDDVDIDVLLQRFSDDPISDFDLDIDLDFDVDLLRESFVPESDLSTNVFQSTGSSYPVPPATSVDSPALEPGSPDSVSSFVNYIENFLMDDVDWEIGGNEAGDAVDLFSDMLFDGSISSKDNLVTPESSDASTKEGQSKEKEVHKVVVIEDDDFVSRKRRRQMRNRESAIISREKKKMYIKELEMKNKHLEIECRRLDYTLRCCMAENMALHQSLQHQKNRSCDAYVAKQESAVLLMESLLLGSLFWFVSLVCLFLAPSLRSISPNLKRILSWSGRDLAMAVARTKSRKSLLLGKYLKLILLRLRKRCRSMRARMKFFLFPLHTIIA